MNSTVAGLEEADTFNPEMGLMHGEQRDMIACRGLKLSSSGVFGWHGIPLSDHFMLGATLDSGETILTFNINGTTLAKDGGRTLDGCDVRPELLAAFRSIWSRKVIDMFAPLAEVIPEAQLQTLMLFWNGPTVFDLDKAARAFSPFLQGCNDLHRLLAALIDGIDNGARPIDVSVTVAEMVDLTSANWKSMHRLPCDWSTGERLSHDNRVQQRANLIAFFYCMAMVASQCPGDFRHAIDTAPCRPTRAALVHHISNILGTEAPYVLALQEVPISLLDPIKAVCTERGYEVYASPIGASPGAVTIAKTVSGGRVQFTGTGDDAHRALITELKLDNGTSIALLNLHGDTDGLTRSKVREVASDFPDYMIVVAGDLQIGKVFGEYGTVVRELQEDLRASADQLSTTPPIITRAIGTNPNVFCCQFKFKNL